MAAAGDEHLLARLVARIGRARDLAREVDAAVQRVLAQDLAGAGRGERVLEVDARVLTRMTTSPAVRASTPICSKPAAILPSRS
jgi:hypothetical protein